jgi:hypothetical protein
MLAKQERDYLRFGDHDSVLNILSGPSRLSRGVRHTFTHSLFDTY